MAKAKAKTRLAGVIHIDDDAPIGRRVIKDSNIAAAFKAASIDVSTLKDRAYWFDQIRHAIAAADQMYAHWEMGLSHDDAVKALSDMIEAADKLQARFVQLLRVDPYSRGSQRRRRLFEFSADHQFAARISRELDGRLAGSGIDARILVHRVSEPLAPLRGHLKKIASRLAKKRAPKRRGKSWSHLEKLLYAVHDVLTWNGISTGFRNTSVYTKTRTLDKKTSSVGLIVFSLTKLLRSEMRPENRTTVETLYRKIRPAIKRDQQLRLNRWRPRGT